MPTPKYTLDSYSVEDRGYDTPCWIWQGGISNWGYGVIHVAGRRSSAKAHKISYESHIGPVPEGKVLDHGCRNRSCINPDHLDPVSNLENTYRGVKGYMSLYCKNGHYFSPENMIWSSGKGRTCKTCKQQRTRDWKRRLRAEAKQSPCPVGIVLSFTKNREAGR